MLGGGNHFHQSQTDLTRRCVFGRFRFDCRALTQRAAVGRFGEAHVFGTAQAAGERRALEAAFADIAAEEILQVSRRAALLAAVHRRARLTLAEQTTIGVRAVAQATVERAGERRRTDGDSL